MGFVIIGGFCVVSVCVLYILANHVAIRIKHLHFTRIYEVARWIQTEPYLSAILDRDPRRKRFDKAVQQLKAIADEHTWRYMSRMHSAQCGKLIEARRAGDSLLMFASGRTPSAEKLSETAALRQGQVGLYLDDFERLTISGLALSMDDERA